MQWEHVPAEEIEENMAMANGNLQLIRSFLALLPVPGFLKDATGRVIYLNSRAETLFKKHRGQALGKTIPELLDRPLIDSDLKLIDHNLARLHAAHVYANVAIRPHLWLLAFPVTDSSGDYLSGGLLVESHG